MAVVACVTACFALPATGRADTPGPRPIGPPGALSSLAFAPSPGSTRMYARAGYDHWQSDDDGATWRDMGRDPDRTCAYAVSPANPNWIYTGCQLMSFDGGATWKSFAPIEGVPSIDSAGTLYYSNPYTGTAPVVRRCTADASSCADLPLPGPGRLEVDPAASGLLLDVAGGAFWASTDGGMTWAPHLPPASMVAANVVFDARVASMLLAAGHDINGNQLFAVSTNSGLTWGPAHAEPLMQGSGNATLLSGGAGAKHRVWIDDGKTVAWTGDDGATFHPVTMPPGTGQFLIDPNDGAHAIAGDSTLLSETRDAGATWSVRNDGQFGYQPYTNFTGSGSQLYLTISNIAWSSQDAGLHWAPIPALEDDPVYSVLASRDDPRIAYAAGARPGVALTIWKTVDGGLTWDPRPAPAYESMPYLEWIDSGQPDWVSANGELSHDGGHTWNEIDLTNACFVNFTAGAPNSANGTATCDRFFVADPLKAPWNQSFSTVRSVLLDRGSGTMISLDPLGRVNADWSFTGPCLPKTTPCTGPIFTSSGEGDALLSGGHLTYAYGDGAGNLWVMRDGGRWWQIPLPADMPGGQAAPVRLLSESSVAFESQFIRLTAPPLGAPSIVASGATLGCATPLTADEADLAYAWRRDGAAIAGSGSTIAASPGHVFACSVTATNPWGSSSATSAAYRVAVPAAASTRRLTFTGLGYARGILRCGTRLRVTWLRDSRALKGAHSPLYRVVTRDEGHTIACEFRASDGTLARSLSLRIPVSRGGQSRAPAVSP